LNSNKNLNKEKYLSSSQLVPLLPAIKIINNKSTQENYIEEKNKKNERIKNRNEKLNKTIDDVNEILNKNEHLFKNIDENTVDINDEIQTNNKSNNNSTDDNDCDENNVLLTTNKFNNTINNNSYINNSINNNNNNNNFFESSTIPTSFLMKKKNSRKLSLNENAQILENIFDDDIAV
jgi:hypothetical protein